MEKDREVLFLECSCRTPDHLLKFEIDNYDAKDGWLVATTVLSPYSAWYRRLWLGLKFIFFSGELEAFDSWVCTYDDVGEMKRLRDLLDRFIDKAERAKT